MFEHSNSLCYFLDKQINKDEHFFSPIKHSIRYYTRRQFTEIKWAQLLNQDVSDIIDTKLKKIV